MIWESCLPLRCPRLKTNRKEKGFPRQTSVASFSNHRSFPSARAPTTGQQTPCQPARQAAFMRRPQFVVRLFVELNRWHTLRQHSFTALRVGFFLLTIRPSGIKQGAVRSVLPSANGYRPAWPYRIVLLSAAPEPTGGRQPQVRLRKQAVARDYSVFLVSAPCPSTPDALPPAIPSARCLSTPDS